MTPVAATVSVPKVVAVVASVVVTAAPAVATALASAAAAARGSLGDDSAGDHTTAAASRVAAVGV